MRPGVRVRRQLRLQRNVMGCVEALFPDDLRQPLHGADLQNAEAKVRQRGTAGTATGAKQAGQ